MFATAVPLANGMGWGTGDRRLKNGSCNRDRGRGRKVPRIEPEPEPG